MSSVFSIMPFSSSSASIGEYYVVPNGTEPVNMQLSQFEILSTAVRCCNPGRPDSAGRDVTERAQRLADKIFAFPFNVNRKEEVTILAREIIEIASPNYEFACALSKALREKPADKNNSYHGDAIGCFWITVRDPLQYRRLDYPDQRLDYVGCIKSFAQK